MINILFEPERKRAAAYDGATNIGKATYSESENLWVLDHTFVNKNYGGQGIAAGLVDKVVENARTSKVKVLPLCSYAKKQFDLNPEYSDVLAKEACKK
ncbi:GNAT family N-acetyltransferase [Eubacteriales bacterium KG127]